jgi:hypothetical protein
MAIATERRPTRLAQCAHDGCPKPHVLGDRFCFDHLDPEELEAAINEPDDEDLAERVQRLERATAPSAPEEVAAMPTGSPGLPSPTPRIDPPWECRCGRFTTDWPASKAKHLLACDGKPKATSGRIAAAHPELEPAKPKRAYVRGTPPATSSPHSTSKNRNPVQRRKTKSKRAVSRPGRPARRSPAQRTGRELVAVATGSETADALIAISVPSARLTFLDQLRVARSQIDTAITAIEALG